jgi:hypothetical protein
MSWAGELARGFSSSLSQTVCVHLFLGNGLGKQLFSLRPSHEAFPSGDRVGTPFLWLIIL